MIAIFQDEQKLWRWEVSSRNKRRLACSAIGYRRRIDCLNALNSLLLLLRAKLPELLPTQLAEK